jgi:hypothetical protein
MTYFKNIKKKEKKRGSGWGGGGGDLLYINQRNRLSSEVPIHLLFPP